MSQEESVKLKEQNKKLQERIISMIASSSSDRQNKASELGLWEVWVYKCMRCGYMWLPKDFDYKIDKLGDSLFERQPPKACARCKSKYWNEIPRRNTAGSDENMPLVRKMALRRRKAKDKNLWKNYNKWAKESLG